MKQKIMMLHIKKAIIGNILGEFPCAIDQKNINNPIKSFITIPPGGEYSFEYITAHCILCDYFSLCQFRAFILENNICRGCGQ